MASHVIFWIICEWFMFLHKDSPPTIFPLEGTQIIAHRGLTTHHLENTLEALEAAFDIGNVDGVEFDVQLSADKTPWVFHDRNLRRLTNDSRNIDELSDLEIRNLDQYYRGQTYKIATLSSVLKKLPKNKILNIELKETTKKWGEEGIKKITEVLRSNNEKLILVSSFDPAILKMVNRISPNLTLGLLLDEGIRSFVPAIFSLGIVSYLIPHISLLSRGRSQKIANGGPPLILWGHKALGDEGNFVSENHRGVITDVPEELKNVWSK